MFLHRMFITLLLAIAISLSPFLNRSAYADFTPPQTTLYVDGDNGTFGTAVTGLSWNTSFMGAYEYRTVCGGDANRNGIVDIDDLVLVITSWGPCTGACPTPPANPAACAGDVTSSSCTVDIDDLVLVETNWGCGSQQPVGPIPQNVYDCMTMCSQEMPDAWANCCEKCIAGLYATGALP